MHTAPERIIENIRTELGSRIKKIDKLSEYDIWSEHGPMVWEAEKFSSTPFFYPVYKYKNYFSYSFLNLVILKGEVNFTKEFQSFNDKKDFLCSLSSQVIDPEIQKIGSFQALNPLITSPMEYAESIALALKNDIKRIETLNSGYKNYILCGGKDSLNLLLLPWINEVIALSAQPNYPIVKKFIKKNGLDIEIIELKDYQNNYEINQEILEAFGRIDLVNWRWGEHLRQISSDNAGKLIYWKGQMADMYMAEKWMTYLTAVNGIQLLGQKIFKRTRSYLPNDLKIKIAKKIHHKANVTAWERGSIMQGAHLAMIRQICDCLTLSAYHGPEMSNIFQMADLPLVADIDMRELVGEILYGRKVHYPSSNPAPGPSKIRQNLFRLDTLESMLLEGGINVNRYMDFRDKNATLHF